MAAITIQFHHGGVHLPQLGLWLDPHEPQLGPERVFVSHAHADHIGAHREVILTRATSRFMQARMGGTCHEHILPFGQPSQFVWSDSSWRITLLPAGHIFGSAMSLIEVDGQTLLYTGDFKLRRGLSAEPCEPRHADVLIMETTYGRPEYQFPPTNSVLQGVIRFCREALDNDETPVLLGYSLGKSQELLRGLAAADLSIMLHDQVHKLTLIYEQLGHHFPAYEPYEAERAAGKVLICPPGAAASARLRNLGRVRTAVLTGWAVDPNCRFRYQVDAAFPLSDHADFPDLVEFVNRVAPKKVFTLHGFAADFAQTLRDLGFDAQSLSEDEQLALSLGDRCPTFNVPSPKSAWLGVNVQPTAAPRRDGQQTAVQADFRGFAETCARVAATTKKLEKVGLLGDYLRALDPAELNRVATWFAGHPFAPSRNKILQLGWALIRDSLCAISRISENDLRQVYLKHSDLGETAFELLENRSIASGEWSIEDVGALFEKLHGARGPSGKLPLLADALARCSALEAKFLVKILTGDLRIGLKEGLVEEAIAAAFGASLTEVKRAHLLLGDIGETAESACRGQLACASVAPFRPIKFMLASPEETATGIWERMGGVTAMTSQTPSPTGDAGNSVSTTADEIRDRADRSPSGTMVWLEDKYDGIRCQLHKVAERVELYSRDLKPITNTFGELADAASHLREDVILDGEILAMCGEKVLPFADLQRRLGRRESDLFLGDEVPVRFIAFDLLWRDGRSLVDEPLAARRCELERIAPWPGSFRLAQITAAASANDIEAAFAAARARGNEGLMVKDPQSTYSPGRRGLAWLKLKKAFATLDCVVVGAEYGHGKRKSVLSDYTFAVRDENSGELKTIGKAYTGLTDAEIAALTRHFLSKTVRQRGRYHEVEPDTVLEIAFDSLRPSARHTSGLAMRFPRIVRIRADKSPNEIDTVATARTLVQPG